MTHRILAGAGIGEDEMMVRPIVDVGAALPAIAALSTIAALLGAKLRAERG